jgi:hypothetical protein
VTTIWFWNRSVLETDHSGNWMATREVDIQRRWTDQKAYEA